MPKKPKRGALAASVRRLWEEKGWSIYRLAKESVPQNRPRRQRVPEVNGRPRSATTRPA